MTTFNINDRVDYPGAISRHTGTVVGFNDDGDPRVKADRTGNVWVVGVEHLRHVDGGSAGGSSTTKPRKDG